MMDSMRRRFESSKSPEETALAAAASQAATVWVPAISNTHLPSHRLQRRMLEFPLTPIPLLLDAPIEAREHLFVQKLRLCSYVFPFDAEIKANHIDEPSIHLTTAVIARKAPDPFAVSKEVKRNTLLELIQFMSDSAPAFCEATLGEVMEMVAANLFRALSPCSAELGNFDPTEDDPAQEPSWPHLQLVYEFLHRFINSTETDPKLLKKCISAEFVFKILQQFDAEDPRERDYLKTILHRLYSKFMSLRAFVRKTINHIFHRFVYESERHNGIAELLEIYGSIVNGFARPLKDEHKQFLRQVLIPLHKPGQLPLYHPQLSYAVIQFVEKEPALSEDIVLGLLRFWPVAAAKKQVLFMNELDEVLERITELEFDRFSVLLFGQLARAIESRHFQVAERAIFLLNNDALMRYLTQNRAALFPLLFVALQRNVVTHWNPAVLLMTQNYLKLFEEIDGRLFELCRQSLEGMTNQQACDRQRRQLQWEQLTADTVGGSSSANSANNSSIETGHRSSLASGNATSAMNTGGQSNGGSAGIQSL